jgi:CHAT domain-containing protein
MPVKRVVLAEYFTSDDLTLLFIIRPDFDEPEVVEIKRPLKEIQQFVFKNFREMRDTEGHIIKRTDEMMRELDEATYQEFFNPFVVPLISQSHKGDLMTEEGDLIWFVPHNVLHYLPLHALKVGDRYLIERNSVCYTPSASVMKYCHAKRRDQRTRAFVMGDSRNDLIHAREEALIVAKLFNTKPYLTGQATKSLFREKLKKERDALDILHFSCHGYFRQDQPLKSGIMLAMEQNGNSNEEDKEKWNLTAEEIFGLEMHADLVTLSACETGINDRRPGDELIGLTRALIYAGTPSVLVSLWAVDDLSTRLLMQRFYQELQKPPLENDVHPVTKAEALKTAQLYVKNMTAKMVVDYCDKRLLELSGSEDQDLIMLLQLDRANAQVVAGDLKKAITTYREVDSKLGRPDSERESKLAPQVKKTLKLMEIMAEDAQHIDYEKKPFEHIYYWAAFILVGDWR